MGMSRSHAETAYCHVTMTQCHVTTTQCHVTKSRIAASADSKLFAGGHCDVAKGHCDVATTRFHMDMSRRHLSTHDCGCTPTQNPVEETSNHMPATQSESALEQTRLMLPQILPADGRGPSNCGRSKKPRPELFSFSRAMCGLIRIRPLLTARENARRIAVNSRLIVPFDAPSRRLAVVRSSLTSITGT